MSIPSIARLGSEFQDIDMNPCHESLQVSGFGVCSFAKSKALGDFGRFVPGGATRWHLF
jgi:hypothetical protein